MSFILTLRSDGKFIGYLLTLEQELNALKSTYE